MLTLLFLIGRDCYQIGEIVYKEKIMITTIIEVSRAVFIMSMITALISGVTYNIALGL